jgi:hypothetical protein
MFGVALRKKRKTPKTVPRKPPFVSIGAKGLGKSAASMFAAGA